MLPTTFRLQSQKLRSINTQLKYLSTSAPTCAKGTFRFWQLKIPPFVQAVGMGNHVKSYGENLVGRRVKFWWPKEESFCEGIVSSHGLSRKNLGAEEKNGPFCSSSHMIPEGEELIGCRVNVWQPKSKTFSEGVVAAYDISHKEHVVAYANGTREMMNLREHREPAGDVSPDRAQNEHTQKARDPSSVNADDDMDARSHVGKKRKAQSFDHTTPCPSPISSENLKRPKLENDIEPTDSKSSVMPGDDNMVKINGYKVKTTSAPVIEAIFAKYGDIMANCVCKSTSVRASLLEVICNIVQRLQYLDVEAILSNIEDIENEISDLDASNIKVSWLHEHFAKLSEIAGFQEKSLELKKTKVRCSFVTKAASKELKRRHMELVLAQERFKEAENCVNALRLVSRKLDDDLMEYESEEYFWKRRLDDLI